MPTSASPVPPPPGPSASLPTLLGADIRGARLDCWVPTPPPGEDTGVPFKTASGEGAGGKSGPAHCGGAGGAETRTTDSEVACHLVKLTLCVPHDAAIQRIYPSRTRAHETRVRRSWRHFKERLNQDPPKCPSRGRGRERLSSPRRVKQLRAGETGSNSSWIKISLGRPTVFLRAADRTGEPRRVPRSGPHSSCHGGLWRPSPMGAAEHRAALALGWGLVCHECHLQGTGRGAGTPPLPPDRNAPRRCQPGR